eukprot:6464771-Amphidinium_carterae.1
MPVRKRIVAQRSKEQRREHRSALGKWSNLVVLPSTLHCYTDSVQRFVDWLRLNQHPFPTTPLRCDRACSAFLEELWECGEAKSEAANVLSGIQHFLPFMRHKLLSSWRLYTAWSKHELPRRAPPLSMELAYALAFDMYTQKWPFTALLILLGMHTALRSGELFSITVGSLQINGRIGLGVVVLPFSKNGTRFGMTETVPITDNWLGRQLFVACHNRSPDQLFGIESGRVHRTRLAQCLSRFGVAQHAYTWYSVRRGCATSLFKIGVKLNAILV